MSLGGTASRTRTVAGLLADAGLLAAALPERGRGGEVVLVCNDRYLFTVSLLAAWHRGFIVALPPNAQPAMVTSVRRSGNVATVLHDQDGMLGVDVRAVLATGAASPPLPRPESMDAARPALVVYTSGSTGTPMPCRKTAGQIVGEAAMLARAFGIMRGERVLATVPPHHIYGLLFGVLVPLVAGAAFGRDTTLHAGPLAELVKRDRARVLVSVPVHLRALSMLEAGELPPLTRVFSSGAPLAPETAHMVQERFGWKVTEVLGSSETGGIAWRQDPAEPWQPFAPVKVQQGEGARLLVDSPFLDPHATRPHVAGDRIELLPDGRFRHLGRADGVIKVGATRISIAEIERRVLALPGVRDAAALAVDVGPPRGWESWVAVVVDEGAEVSAASVREALRAWLDAVVLPRRVKVVDAIPRETTGKLSRDALRELFGGQGGTKAPR